MVLGADRDPARWRSSLITFSTKALSFQLRLIELSHKLLSHFRRFKFFEALHLSFDGLLYLIETYLNGLVKEGDPCRGVVFHGKEEPSQLQKSRNIVRINSQGCAKC
jgi:hypothetical protein